MLQTKVEVIHITNPFNNNAVDFFSLNPLEKLDNTLSLLNKFSQSRNDLQNGLGLQITPETTYEIEMVLNKLVKDQYVNENKIEDKYEGPEWARPLGGVWHISYKSTFEGEYLKINGGYTGLKIQKDSETARLSLNRLESYHNKLAAWVAGGTVALVIVEVIKIFIDHF